MPATPDLSAPGTPPYRDPYDADGQPLPQQAYNGSKDVHGRPICAPAPVLPGNGGKEIAGSPWLTDPAPVVDVAPVVTPDPTPTPEVAPVPDMSAPGVSGSLTTYVDENGAVVSVFEATPAPETTVTP